MSTFSDGQQVRAVASFGWCITEGTVYTVVTTIPRLVTPYFTFPEYVTVIDDHGDRCMFHTYRFKPVD